MERFYTIRFKRKTAQRFKRFSKKISKTYSGTLDAIMDFFEWHGFTPSERFTKSLLQEIIKNRQKTETSIKRTEASIAIIRDIEVNQTKPNNAMLLSLFGANAEEEKPIRKEKKLLEKKPEQTQEIEITIPKIRYERLAEKMENMTNDFGYVLSKVTVAKSSFGKEYLKLEISKGELEKFTRTLKNL